MSAAAGPDNPARPAAPDGRPTAPAGPPPGPPDTERALVVEHIRRLSLELDRFVDVFARRHALHRTDLDAIGHLWEAERSGAPLTPTRLATSLALSPAATTASLDRLTRSGHVVRRSDPADRRRTFVTLSDQARTLGMEFFRPLAQRMQEAMAPFDDAEIATVARFLTTVTDATAALTAEVDEPPRS